MRHNATRVESPAELAGLIGPAAAAGSGASPAREADRPRALAGDERRRFARIALACLDLTSLNDGDSALTVAALCARAVGPAGRGPVAAVCVWPRHAALARAQLPAGIAVAAVANFPDGGADIARALGDVRMIVAAGADEVDLVLPYRHLDTAAAPLLDAVRRACRGLRLKVILETGVLADARLIRRACRIALEGGADFLKTSTGKVAVNATPAAAERLLDAIAGHPRARTRVGFKPAGGMRSVDDAAVYIALTEARLGAAALNPARLRLGASSLLDDIEAALGFAGGAAAGAARTAY